MDNTWVGMEFSEEHYAALGKLLVAFQRLEVVVSSSIYMLSGQTEDEIQGAFFLKMLNESSFGNRLNLLSNFIHTTKSTYFVSPGEDTISVIRQQDYEEAVAQSERGIRQAGECEERRNQLVHSQWLAGGVVLGPPDTVLRMKSRAKAKKDQSQSEHLTANAILQEVKKMDDASMILYDAASHLRYLRRVVANPEAHANQLAQRLPTQERVTGPPAQQDNR